MSLRPREVLAIRREADQSRPSPWKFVWILFWIIVGIGLWKMYEG